MRESPHITLTEEQAKRETIHCIVWASIVVFGMLALTAHGLAFLSWTEPTMEDAYARKRLEQRQQSLYDIQIIILDEFKNHTHRYHDGKIK